MSEQIAVRIPDSLAHDLGELVEAGKYPTKAEAIRQAIQTLVDEERRREIGRAIADGYRRIPQSDEEVEQATRATIRSIEEEPW